MNPTSDNLRRALFQLGIPQTDEHSLAPWSRVWELFVEHPWYEQQLDRCARGLIRRRATLRISADDLKQEAHLLLARDLARTPDLGLSDADTAEHFESWIRTIVSRHCRQALRRARCRVRLEALPDNVVAEESSGTSASDRIDLSLAIDALDEPDRTAVHLYSEGYNRREIARRLSLPYERTRYVLERGLVLLRRALSDPGRRAA